MHGAMTACFGMHYAPQSPEQGMPEREQYANGDQSRPIELEDRLQRRRDDRGSANFLVFDHGLAERGGVSIFPERPDKSPGCARRHPRPAPHGWRKAAELHITLCDGINM